MMAGESVVLLLHPYAVMFIGDCIVCCTDMVSSPLVDMTRLRQLNPEARRHWEFGAGEKMCSSYSAMSATAMTRIAHP